MPHLVPFDKYQWPSIYDAPYQHQIETFKFIIKYKRGYILNTMGTGKTLSCIWAAHFLYINDYIRKVLIVAPLSILQSVWADEIFFNIPNMPFVVLHGTKAKRRELLKTPALFYIINHDGIKVIEDEIKKARFDIVYIDELTAFKNHRAERTKCMKRICDKAKSVIGLTGSMTANSPLDAFGQVKVVNSKNPHVPTYWTRFRDLLMTQFDMYTYLPRPGWEKILEPMVQPAIRYKMEDCIDIPEIIYHPPRDVPMGAKQEKLYKEMKKDFLAEYEEGLITAANAGVKRLKLLQISAGAVLNDEGNVVYLDNTSKLRELLNIYEQSFTKKLIIFSMFVAPLKQISKYLTKHNISNKMIYGDVSSSKRSTYFYEFQNGNLQVLVMQPKVAAHGLNLKVSDTVIWYTPAPSNDIYQQANHRIRRPGQKNKQNVLKLQSSPLEKKVYEAIDNNEDLNQVFLSMFQ